ncbi:MAG: hypothetical protein ABI586_07820, partial [Candidatus Nanopelagicales bacterium]
MSSLNRRFVGITAAAVLTAALVPLNAVTADAAVTHGTSTNPARIGLYGQQTPKYDGVYRQGLTILALTDSGATVDPTAIRWLRRQQCDNGKFMSFRSDLTQSCGAADSNATAMAIMAFRAIGRNAAAQDAFQWLMNQQLPGGGWEYTAGWGADSNSTGLVVQAMIAMGVDPTTVNSQGTAIDFLKSVQLRCDEPDADQRGALDYLPEPVLIRNDYATAQATQALARTTLPVAPEPGSTALPELSCGAKATNERVGSVSATAAAAGYLGRRLEAHSGTIPNAFGGGSDYGSTANAVLSLVAAGYGANQVTSAMTALE